MNSEEKSPPKECAIELLGGLRLSDGSVWHTFAPGRAATLLAFLALHLQPFSRETLCEMLWPDVEPGAGRNRLRVTLARLRAELKIVGAETILIAKRDSIALDTERVETDVSRFQNALKTARRQGSYENWRACVEFFGAPLLPDFLEEWSVVAATQLENEYFYALQKTLETAPVTEFEVALHLAARGLQRDATREEIHRGVMQIHLARGNHHAARRQFQVLETVLRERLNAAPDAVTRALISDLQTPATPLSAPASSASSLPQPLTKFFDRREELHSLQKWLESDDDIRCVTLTGTGGVGKTRLAIEAARQWQNGGGEVVFVPLEGLPDAAFLWGAIWGILDSSRENGTSPVASPLAKSDLLDLIAGFWKNRRALLVLDNFEQLVEDGAPLLAQLIARAPELRILVASRQRLHIAGEREIAVPTLSFSCDEMEVSQAQTQAAIQMFCDRARAAAPDWKLSARNVAAVVKLCERLDGLPLAIELVAARAGVLAPAQMLSRLEARLDLEAKAPSGFLQGKPERHRTLSAALEWSYELLSPELRAFFASLSIFRGGWNGQSCQEICRESRALHFLSQLRAASLIVAHEADDAMRFRLLESLRILAREQLSSREHLALARRHAAYFMELAERAAPHLSRGGGDDFLQSLEIEQDNFRAALDWSLRYEPVWALRIATALSDFWEMKSRNTEGSNWIERALSAAPDAEPLLQARALEASSRLALRTQNYQIAYERAEAACQALRAQGDRRTLAHALCSLGLVCLIRSEFARTRELYHEALQLARQLDDEPFVANLLIASLQLMASIGDFDAALPLAQESVALCRKSGSQAALLVALVTHAQVFEERDELDDAQRVLDELMPLAIEIGPTWDHSRALWVAANCARKRGERNWKQNKKSARADFQKARDFSVASLQMLIEEMYDPMPVAIVMTDCAFGLLASSHAREAVTTLGAAQAIRAQHQLPVLPIHKTRYEKCLRDAEKILGASEFDNYQKRGHALSPAQLVQFLQTIAL